MEGWLYLISSNRIIPLQFYRKRYFVLHHHLLKSFRSIPLSIHHDQDSISSATIDSCIGVSDNGIERIRRRVLFIFTVYNASNRGDQLKLGARSAEEAECWIRSLKNAALKEDQNHVVADCSLSQPLPVTVRSHCSSKLENLSSIDWTTWSIKAKDATTCGVVTPSRWTIFGYQQGLRLFNVAKDGGFHGNWNKHPAIMAVGVIDVSSEVIFRTLMSLGPSRSEWDFCFDKGSVIEHLDGHNDIVHNLLHRDWLPWGMKPRDLLLQRQWRKDDDGTHVILYHSVTHHKCPKEKGSVQAYLKCGGFVVSPMNEGRQSVVKHMLAIDWKSRLSCFRSYSSRCITIRMVETLAALREMFRAKAEVESFPGFSMRQSGEELKLDESEEDEDEEVSKTPSEYGSLIALSEGTTEFFDVFEPSNFDLLEDGWSSDFTTDIYSQGHRHPKYLSTAVFARKLHDFAVSKREYADLNETAVEQTCNYGFTLPKDPSGKLHCSWTTADPSEFMIRGKTYDVDRKKIKAEGTLMQMVAADWLKSDKREDDLGGRPNSIVQKYAARNSPEFFFIINIQFPGVTTHNLAFYYMMNTPVEDVPLLDKFIKADDAYRNSRFKLIPYICQGPWIVKQTVVKKPTLLGQALKVTYFRGKNYLELGVDIGSSRLARHMAGLVLGYLNNAVTDLAFLIQGNTSEELPEIVLGTCRLNRLDPSKTVPVKS